MSFITYFSPAPADNELPTIFLSPFSNKPHPLAVKASKQLQEYLATTSDWQHDFKTQGGGKMFGVLVVRDTQNRVGFLSAFSGMLAKTWKLPGFVPPLFNQAEIESFLPNGETQLAHYANQISELINNPEYKDLQAQFEKSSQERDDDLLDLNKNHKTRKQDRKIQRESANQTSKIEQKKLLSILSFESQEDKREKKSVIEKWNQHITNITNKIQFYEKQIDSLKNSRAELSKKLHDKVFSSYTLTNQLGEQKKISHFFEKTLPPGGTGDCAAPKLIQYANKNNLTPLAIAEFWWGTSPAGEIRHHGQYYPSCRGKCHPILPFMLKGIDIQPWETPGTDYSNPLAPEVVYEDDVLLVINKPTGLLSIPGKETQDSVYSRIQKRYPQATGPLLVHRLDLDTSGLLLIAKNSSIHKQLQQQFIQRTIEKRYVAILSNTLPDNMSDTGSIELPLRVDIDDRPRQMVCFTHGKPAKTHWEIVSRQSDTTRLYLYPETGRTHQLRVHMAHSDGLNTAILGDRLYGEESNRLYLHAEKLCFIHPVTGIKTEIKSPAPF